MVGYANREGPVSQAQQSVTDARNALETVSKDLKSIDESIKKIGARIQQLGEDNEKVQSKEFKNQVSKEISSLKKEQANLEKQKVILGHSIKKLDVVQKKNSKTISEIVEKSFGQKKVSEKDKIKALKLGNAIKSHLMDVSEKNAKTSEIQKELDTKIGQVAKEIQEQSSLINNIRVEKTKIQAEIENYNKLRGSWESRQVPQEARREFHSKMSEMNGKMRELAALQTSTERLKLGDPKVQENQETFKRIGDEVQTLREEIKSSQGYRLVPPTQENLEGQSKARPLDKPRNKTEIIGNKQLIQDRPVPPKVTARPAALTLVNQNIGQPKPKPPPNVAPSVQRPIVHSPMGPPPGAKLSEIKPMQARAANAQSLPTSDSSTAPVSSMVKPIISTPSSGKSVTPEKYSDPTKISEEERIAQREAIKERSKAEEGIQKRNIAESLAGEIGLGSSPIVKDPKFETQAFKFKNSVAEFTKVFNKQTEEVDGLLKMLDYKGGLENGLVSGQGDRVAILKERKTKTKEVYDQACLISKGFALSKFRLKQTQKEAEIRQYQKNIEENKAEITKLEKEVSKLRSKKKLSNKETTKLENSERRMRTLQDGNKSLQSDIVNCEKEIDRAKKGLIEDKDIENIKSTSFSEKSDIDVIKEFRNGLKELKQELTIINTEISDIDKRQLTERQKLSEISKMMKNHERTLFEKYEKVARLQPNIQRIVSNTAENQKDLMGFIKDAKPPMNLSLLYSTLVQTITRIGNPLKETKESLDNTIFSGNTYIESTKNEVSELIKGFTSITGAVEKHQLPDSFTIM